MFMTPVEIIEEALEKSELIYLNGKSVIPLKLYSNNTKLDAMFLGKVKTYFVEDCIVERWIDDE